MMVASVDIGANSVRLLVGKILPGGHLERISQERAIVRLGRGVKGTGFLQKEPVELALDLLGRYVTIAAEKGVEKILACATSAVRDAKNAPCFLRAVKDETGLEVKVLSGWEEASWSMEGMKGVWEAPPPLWMGVDVGGGSTEIFVAQGDVLLDARSIPLGMVGLTEEFLEEDPPTRESLEMSKERAKEYLHGAIKGIAFWKKGIPLVGTAGTVTTLAALEAGMSHYNGDLIHGKVLSRERVREWIATLATMGREERLKLAGMEHGREDVIVAGAVIVDAVMDLAGASELVVSDHGLLEGIAKMAPELGQLVPAWRAGETRRRKGGMGESCWTMN